MVELTINGKKVLNRFLARDKDGKIIENPEQMFRRVAKNIADTDSIYNENPKKSEQEFFEVMDSLEFLPNIPALANAGRSSQLAACFVLPVPDDLEGIFQAVKEMALIQKFGGGTGFSFSRLRPEGSMVAETGGVASGPVSFMKVFDAATGAIKEGGIRRGANMGILSIEHPDIKKFINAKIKGELPNFNISVSITDNFMKSLEKNKDYFLVDPYTKEKTPRKAIEIFDLICKNAHYNGDPGVIFIDTINKYNPLDEKIESCNPCGEVPLLPYESCILGSINLAKITNEKNIDYKRLEQLVEIGVHFLDNCIDASKFPIPKITETIKKNRKIGLGIMGFADSLIKRNISYNSPEAIKEAGKIMSFIQKKSKQFSRQLAEKRGSFPNIKNTIFKNQKIRNATLTTIAPTGTIAIVADCSEGIEPLFNVVFERYSTYGILTEINPLFKKIIKQYGLNDKEIQKIAEQGTLKNSKLPLFIKKVFVTAHDISPEYHLRIQAKFQKYVDNAISKTVNLPENATIKDVKKTFTLAYKLGCKGLTVYRDKSRKTQVLKLCKCKMN